MTTTPPKVTQKRWRLKDIDPAALKRLQEELPTVHPIVHTMLATRGIRTYDEAKSFFRPTLEALHDPFLMKGMEDAVARINEAIEWHERIMVYGDYDVDGTTAVAVVYSFLKEQYPHGDISYYIPHRYREGYGVSQAGVDYARDNGYTLLITLDCGIKSKVLVDYAQKHGIDVIICDHHTPDEKDLPDAYAILNPKQADCPYPFKELSGCGIGLKLVQALCKKAGLSAETWEKYLDLVATSIAADIVPMEGENRILAYYGIKRVNENPCLAVKTLKTIAGVQKDMSVSDLVFVIGPRVNAAGRMDDARKAVDLFLECDGEKSKVLAQALQENNYDRKEVDKTITAEALALLADAALQSRNSTVLYQAHWHKGVVGIVASRLIDHYYRPTIVLTGGAGGKVAGSARSVQGFNIYEAIHQCRDLLENYGGHFYAAGMTMRADKVEAFQQRFEEVVSSTILPHMLVPEIEIDAELSFSDIRQPFYNLIRQFEPYGPGNLRPVFLSRRVYDYRGLSKIVKDTHLRFVVQQRGSPAVEGIGFGLGDRYDLVEKGPVDIVYTLEENEFNGAVRLQIKVIDVRCS